MKNNIEVGQTVLFNPWNDFSSRQESTFIKCRVEKLTPGKRIADIFFLKKSPMFTVRRMRVETKHLFVRYRK